MDITEFFESNRSVCPHASRCVVQYVDYKKDYRPALEKMKRRQAVVIIGDTNTVGFEETKFWARTCYLKATIAAVRTTYPQLDPTKLWRTVMAEVAPSVMDDTCTMRPHIVLRGEALATICMAPAYPASHPRFAPVPVLILTWLDDVNGVILPHVREVMAREHGSVYDALELMLPLPKDRT